MEEREAWQEALDHTALAKWCVLRFLRNPAHFRFDFDELLVAAHLAIYRAAKSWDESKAAKSTFYVLCVNRVLISEVRRLETGQRTWKGYLYAEVAEQDSAFSDAEEEDGEGRPSALRKAIQHNSEAEARADEEDLIARLDFETVAPLVRAAVMTLPPRQRAVVCRRFWKQQMHKDIARDLGLRNAHASEDAYRNALVNLRRRLPEELADIWQVMA